jgi:RNA polymerase sigma factor (sigma-70 family)
MTDNRTLIAQYSQNGSESAFRELVSRYINFVHSTAMRLVGGDNHLAEDVTQTVFIHLAQNADRLSGNVMLGGWLHRDACNVAAKVMRGQRRRQVREKEAAEMNTIQDHSEENLARIAPVLDDAINHLGSRDRMAILLRFFDQLDFRAVGQAIGTSEDAAKKRVSRALDKLHHRLTVRGVTLSTAALVGALGSGAVKAAPAGLLAKVAGTALASSAVVSGAGLTFIKAMTTSKLGFGLASAVLVASVVFAAKEEQTMAKLRDKRALLGQQNQLAASELQRMSNQLAQVTGDLAESQSQLGELLRLRGEVGALKQQLADAAKVRQKNEPPQIQAGADALEQKTQGFTKGRDAKIIGYAFRMYAINHHDQFPTDFAQAVPYMAEALRNDLNPGDTLRDEAEFIAQVTNRFEIVYTGSTTNEAYGDKILIREKQPTQASDGSWIKAYGFVDGSGQLHSEPDGDFGNWERQHMADLAGQSGK